MDHNLLVTGLQLGLAVITGIVVGAERQISNQDGRKSIGIRDFSLISLLAFISSYLYPVNPSVWPLAFAGVMILGIIVFIFESLGRKEQEGPETRSGITTVLALPVVFLVASLAVFNSSFWLVATVLFVLLIILELKDKWHHFVSTIEKSELFDFSMLIAIALIITPLIPHGAFLKIPLYSFAQQTIVFQHIDLATFWKVIMMVSFMSFVSHFITKYVHGRNALLLATFFGGLVSSLATIILFLRGSTGEGQEGKPRKNLYLAYLAASTGSLFKDLVILFAIVPFAFFQKILFPIASVFLLMVVLTLVTFSRAEDQEEVKFTDRPLPLNFIVKFSGIFSVVMIVMVFVRFYFGSAWLVLMSFLSGLISSAAALASLGDAFREHQVNEVALGIGILFALLGSIAAKYGVVLSHLGFNASRRFFMPIFYMIVLGSVAFFVSFF
jgi:uncharacterized membrane protein (DUF4010 family)